LDEAAVGLMVLHLVGLLANATAGLMVASKEQSLVWKKGI
jgi:hypothetical protein